MADIDRSALTHLMPVVADQDASGDDASPIELVANVLPVRRWAAKPGRRTNHKIRVWPHIWPQPSTVSPQRMRCLCCGVHFSERRAERSCQPRR